MRLMSALVSPLNADISAGRWESPATNAVPARFGLQQRPLEGRETVLPSSFPGPVLFPFTHLSLLFPCPLYSCFMPH